MTPVTFDDILGALDQAPAPTPEAESAPSTSAVSFEDILGALAEPVEPPGTVDRALSAVRGLLAPSAPPVDAARSGAVPPEPEPAPALEFTAPSRVEPGTPELALPPRTTPGVASQVDVMRTPPGQAVPGIAAPAPLGEGEPIPGRARKVSPPEPGQAFDIRTRVPGPTAAGGAPEKI